METNAVLDALLLYLQVMVAKWSHVATTILNYLLLHPLQKINDNGMEYSSCDCAWRNTVKTRTEALEIRNATSRENQKFVDL